ncbi:MAG: DUF370 domain-containing protein [Thermotogae bacterium]|uniref:DUF370 domain-containing protein n=1 Tax=Kosmotoga arenicorallina TaxID=688066 RepID=A0A7C5I124_9BACT|nr:DUF370 domain-containing protein [Kosmotoga sp.]MBO8166353.1 DUF370 domain-containing protein [Kosmotoga sp.]MCD6159981.1 DUF370 domain-containing protein [Kosmotoga sp.]RKX51054.1 MAG: DUF370 domain-containing protein [Thermotogota bacterium]HHF08670.1 DUF370 domain-containing protein [Kosmotoga arenicorallina]
MASIVNIGFDSYVVVDRVMAVLPAHSSAVKRLKQLGVESGKTVNLTFGKRTKSVIMVDSGHILFSFLPIDKLVDKLFSDQEE